MEDLRLTKAPVMKTGLLIRRPVAEVFEAFVDPAITSQFWFTKGSSNLVAGEQVQWEWEMYGFSVPVQVLEIEPNRRILIEWPSAVGQTRVEWTFTPYEGDVTFVNIVNEGFQGTGDELVSQVADSTQGFSLVLAGAKAYLEHGIRLNLVADHLPPS